jgi:putative heme-binding domain-containing protein
LPAAWQDDLFICEPTGYLVQRQETVREQGRWVARRAPLQKEFVASADPYFRPVDLAVGPDGGLYIVDMYRAVIEHPDWAPAELKERADERFGDQQGRIWRVAVPDHQPTQVIPPDAALQPAAWADWLSHPNRWQRSIASRMLFEAAADAESRDPIAAAVTGALPDSASLPAGRARAAAFLAAVDRWDRRLRHRLLTDPDPAVRALAVQLASSFPDADRLILQAAGDADASVQLQAVVAIGSPDLVDRTADPATLVAALAQTAQDHPAAESFQLALGAVDPRLLQPLLMTLSAARGATAVDPSLLEHLATRIGMQVPAAIAPLLASLEQDAASRSVILGILQGARRLGTAIGTLRNTLTPAAATRLDQAFADAARTAADSAASESRRLRALDLLAFSDRAPQTDLRRLVAFDQPPAIRVAVLPLLFGQDRDWFVAWFDREGRSLPPDLRREAIAQLLRTPATSLGLLERIASGEVPISTIGLDASKRLQRAGDPEVKKRAQTIFAAAGADRQAIIDRYQPALTGAADPREGRKLFQEHCAVCHRVDGIGTDVGAEISDSRTKTHAALLTAILHPNAAIDAAYLRYTVLTVDGKVIDGLLVKESADEVTLKVQGGELVVTPRRDIEAFQTAGVSLMPEGFEQVITVDQMRDLISFLKNWRYLDGRVPVETTAGD